MQALRTVSLSQAIEEAVLSYIFDHAARQIKDKCENIGEDDIYSLVGEALDWARRD